MAATVIGYRGYATIRNFWEHYTEFPNLYDRFALSSVTAVAEMNRLFPFAGTRVLSVGSGTGTDSFEIARTARHVTGVEPSREMREYAAAKQATLGINNVEFVDGVAEDLSRFRDDQFDRAVFVHAAPFPSDQEANAVTEALRVARPGGYVAIVSTTPGWRMDHERAPNRADGDSRVDIGPDFLEHHLRPFRFAAVDALTELDYGSVDEALATWGCVYGEEAIDYLLDRQTSKVTWSLRIWYRQV